MSYLSVSTWSLHRLLGPLRWTRWDSAAGTHTVEIQEQPEVWTLLELPAEAARRGYRAVEVVHIHFPSTEEDYLHQVRDAFAAASVSFDTLLLDYGDLSTTDQTRQTADIRYMREWIRAASLCGARQIRIVGGEAPPTDEQAIDRSAAALSELAEFAASLNVRVISENFKPLTSTGDSCLKLLAATGAAIGFITDFGNFKGPAKYAEIPMTIPYSVSVHAKPHYDDQGLPDEAEFRRCLEAAKSAGFDGAYVLIYDGPGDMWAGLDRVKRIVEPFIG